MSERKEQGSLGKGGVRTNELTLIITNTVMANPRAARGVLFMREREWRLYTSVFVLGGGLEILGKPLLSLKTRTVVPCSGKGQWQPSTSDPQGAEASVLGPLCNYQYKM